GGCRGTMTPDSVRIGRAAKADVLATQLRRSVIAARGADPVLALQAPAAAYHARLAALGSLGIAHVAGPKACRVPVRDPLVHIACHVVGAVRTAPGRMRADRVQAAVV